MAAVVLAAWSWARQHNRFLVAGITTTVGFIVWNLTLNATDATGFNVDAPIIRLSWAYAAMGVVLAVLFTRLSPAVEAAGRRAADASTARLRFGLHHSRGVAIKLAGLGVLD